MVLTFCAGITFNYSFFPGIMFYVCIKQTFYVYIYCTYHALQRFVHRSTIYGYSYYRHELYICFIGIHLMGLFVIGIICCYTNSIVKVYLFHMIIGLHCYCYDMCVALAV